MALNLICHWLADCNTSTPPAPFQKKADFHTNVLQLKDPGFNLIAWCSSRICVISDEHMILQNSPVWWCHSFLCSPKSPSCLLFWRPSMWRGEGGELFIYIYALICVYSNRRRVLHNKGCSERSRGTVWGEVKKRRAGWGNISTKPRSSRAAKEVRNVCIYSERQPWDEGE